MTKDFIFDLYIDAKTKISPKIWMVKGDSNGNRFLITLKDRVGNKDKAVNLTDASLILVVFYKEDGNVVNGTAVITDPVNGKIEYIIKGNEISYAGNVECEVQVFGADSRYTTSKFSFEVRESLDNDDAIESTSEYTVLMTLISEVESVIQAEEQRVIAESIRQSEHNQAMIEAADATSAANIAAQNVNAAKDAANTAAAGANAAKDAANTAASSANSAAIAANSAAESANTAATAANEAAAAANAAKDGIQAQYDSLADELASHKTDYATQRQQDQLKVAKVEKDLNEYQQILSQVNVNQEARQKASGYGVVSLPKNAANGQFSDVRIKGNTVFNHADNGVDYANWTVEGIGTTKGAAGIHLVQAGTTERSELSLQLQPNMKYTIVINIKACTLSGTWQINGNSVVLDTVSMPKSLGINKVLIETQSIITSNKIALALRSNNLEGEYIDFEIYAILEGDWTNKEIPFNYPLPYGTISTSSAMRLKSVSEDESEVSMVYVTAKDSEGKIAELRSLPNGTKDEINIGEQKAILRTKKKILEASDITSITSTQQLLDYAVISKPTDFLYANSSAPDDSFVLDGYSYAQYGADGWNDINNIGKVTGKWVTNQFRVGFPKGTTLQQAREALAGTTLIYQLTTPIEIPIQTSGSLVSYPSGTVYVEPVVADAGVYNNGMTVLHQDLPIKAIEKISKIDFNTGLETSLNVANAVVAQDKLSFTHPELQDGNIVFFEYEYDVEFTQGEAEVEYYDSRYTIKDSVTDKFYKWNITVANGVPSIELVEV